MLSLPDFFALGTSSAALCACSILLYVGRRHAARVVWSLVLVGVTVPFLDLHAHTHWAKVGWIPFERPYVTASDIVANVVLYVPFGFLLRSRHAEAGV